MTDIVAHNFITDAVILNLLGVAVCTVYGGMNSEWDTISDMITSDDKLRNAFAAYLVISAILIFSVVYVVMQRACITNWLKNSIYVLYFVFVVSYIGFGVVSTDTDTKTHTLLAITAFTSLLCITGLFIYIQSSVLYPARALTMLLYAVAIASALLWVVTNRYYWEYVIVVAIHFTWLSLAYVCDGSKHITVYDMQTHIYVVPNKTQLRV